MSRGPALSTLSRWNLSAGSRPPPGALPLIPRIASLLLRTEGPGYGGVELSSTREIQESHELSRLGLALSIFLTSPSREREQPLVSPWRTLRMRVRGNPPAKIACHPLQRGKWVRFFRSGFTKLCYTNGARSCNSHPSGSLLAQ